MADKGRAFVKGGFGCLLGFVAIGLLFVLLGGTMRIDLGGAILLFVIGGVIGLVLLAVYNKGRREAEIAQNYPERREVTPAPTAPAVCPSCGAGINPATGAGLHSPVGEPWVLICDQCHTRIETQGRP
jgi:hypothetical protein